MREWSLPGPDALVLDADDVMKFLGIKRTKFYEMLDRHEFPEPRKMGGQSYWTGADIAAFLQLGGRLGGGTETTDEVEDRKE